MVPTEPSWLRTVAVTLSASCSKVSSAQPNRTVTLGSCSATDFNSGSSVYCEMS